ncbi:MAG: hypothetical protein KGL58_03555, partial [Pseudomonadota bacterium]|nr:hypothetical protein [Pseudomonadota bacterium]
FSLSAHADDDDLGYGALGFILGASMAPPPVYYAPPPPPPVVVYRAYPRVYWEDDDRDWHNHGWEERRHHWDRH